MATSTTLLSLAEFQDLRDNGMRHELSEGELIEMPPPKHPHSQAAHAFLFRLYEAAKQHTQFSVRSEAAYRLSRNPPTVRVPDVSILRTERLAGTPADGYVPGAPELAIEVISPSDTAEDLMHKIQQYFEAGATTVWAAYLKDRSIQVYRRGEPALTLRPGRPARRANPAPRLVRAGIRVFLKPSWSDRWPPSQLVAGPDALATRFEKPGMGVF